MTFSKKQLIAQIYGYIVCFACIITMIVSISTLANGVLDLYRPLASGGRYYSETKLASFEAYKMSIRRDKEDKNAAMLDEKELRAAYDSEVKLAVESNRFEAVKNIVTSSIVLLFAVAIFWAHWFWLGKIRKKEDEITE